MGMASDPMKILFLSITLLFSVMLSSCSSMDADDAERAKIRVDAGETSGPVFMAYSLRQAAAQLKASRATAPSLHTLGGITALAGIVYDRSGSDLILVGQASPELQPISLDHLAVSLKAVLVHKELPLVSIEPGPATKETGLLDVVFRGHITDTAYGDDMLVADVALKKLILGVHPPREQGVLSYFDRFAADSRERTEERITQSRFWFDVVGEPALSIRDDAIMIRGLRIGVQEEVLYASLGGRETNGASVGGDSLGEQFSRDLTNAFYDISDLYPEVARVKTLLDLVVLARGIEQLQLDRPSPLDYWLSEYDTAVHATPRAVDILTEQKHVQDAEGRYKAVELSGGVRLSARAIRLRSGAIGAFRDATLESRPGDNSLLWRVPLDGWKIPDALRATKPTKSDSPAQPRDHGGQGTFIEAQARLIESAPLQAPVSHTPPSRQLPAIGVYDSLIPRESTPNVKSMPSAANDAPEAVYPIPLYHALAKTYLAGDDSLSQLLAGHSSSRALFGLPLSVQPSSSADTDAAGKTPTWLRYDFALKPSAETSPMQRMVHDPNLEEAVFPAARAWPSPIPTLSSQLQVNLRPGGILLAPELEIVVESKGLSNALSQKALKSFNAGQVGGKFTHEKANYIVVKAPRSSKVDRHVPAGKYTLHQQDLLAVGPTGDLALDRHYDSTSDTASPLGPRWSLLPFTLETDGATSWAKGMRVFRRPVLRDWQAGLELKYRFERGIVDLYKPLGPDQPRLVVEDNAHYAVFFAHGLVVRFDQQGRLKTIGKRGAGPYANYHYQNGKLARITGPAGSIDLQYGLSGALQHAVTDDGRVADYEIDSAGRLTATVTDEVSYRFAYTDDGLLRTVTKAKSRGRAEAVVDNTYDTYGRMLTHRTPEQRWNYAYDDRLGKATVKGSKGKQSTFVYDGQGRLVAYGENTQRMTLLNYDADGQILQVALGQLMSDGPGKKLRFKVATVVSPPVKAKGK